MTVFVAGPTGATGRVFVPMATGLDLRLHVRPKTAAAGEPLARDPRAHIFDLSDASALTDALRGCDAVLSLVGTMRKRFSTGDTYESSDIESTRQLADAATAAAVPRFLLLSSLGAGGRDPYSHAKGECERIVQESGLEWTIWRPSALVSPPEAEAGRHGRRDVPSFLVTLGEWMRTIPGLRAPMDDVRPMPLPVLCRSFLDVLAHPRPGAVLAGREIWA